MADLLRAVQAGLFAAADTLPIWRDAVVFLIAGSAILLLIAVADSHRG